MSDRREYHRLYKQKQREAARKAGLCVICCANKPRKGNATCDKCQERNNEYKKH